MMDLFDTAVSAGQFSTLLRLAELAGLTETLRGEGPLTVFAPTDEAFASLPQEKKEKLQLVENRDRLTAVLTYHVIPGSHASEELLNTDHLMTIQGGELAFRKENEIFYVNQSRVLTPDIQASNGIIHMIDRVLLPCCSTQECVPSDGENVKCDTACPITREGTDEIRDTMQNSVTTMVSGVSEAMRSGAADARAMAGRIIPATGNLISRGVYGLCYGISYGVVFPTMLVVSILPTDNAFCHGLVDGAHAAGDSVRRLRSSGLRRNHSDHASVVPGVIPTAVPL